MPSALPIHFLLYQMNASAYFNRRSPRGERLAQQQCCCETNRFQSTLPVGGATSRRTRIILLTVISIHAPRGGSDIVNYQDNDDIKISIHAPRGGSDQAWQKFSRCSSHFNPRSPWGGATGRRGDLRYRGRISIHAPREGSDVPQFIIDSYIDIFQSTLPVGGATGEKARMMSEWEFQSTLPVGERQNGMSSCGPFSGFQSTLPAGGATSICTVSNHAFLFQSTLPVGGDKDELNFDWNQEISIHAPRGGSDTYDG